ncbi:MAG: hypothetical protein H7Z40_02105 [Phycisphaerae bacterium]|nr:hypothetical protein [Gemmatimonadaceae bacterium]
MTGSPAALALPFHAPAADADFVGRHWVFQRLNHWLDTDGRFFHVVGEPGSGKSALSRHLVQTSSTPGAHPGIFPRLTPGFLSASHFCSARDRRLVNPLVFAESIGSQLSANSPVFMQAMLKASGITINVEQQIGVAHADTVGVIIQELNARSASPEDTFNRLVREPLEALCRAEPSREIVILVDALDESLVYRGDVGILALLAEADTLPDTVRFVVTSRPLPEIDRSLAPFAHGVERLAISAAEWDLNNQQDIGAYVTRRFATDPQIAAQISLVGVTPAVAAVAAETVSERAGGNFLYARFLLDAVASGQWRLDELHTVPAAGALRGMEALYLLYMSSLERAIKIAKRDWRTDYAPIMETLSAAQETLPRERLRVFSGQKQSTFQDNLEGLRQFTEQVALPSGETGLRLYHQSFAEFLRVPVLLQQNKADVENPYHLTVSDSHARFADVIARDCGPAWSGCEDRYALRYAAAHYAGAAATEQPERHNRSTVLLTLVTDEVFRQAHRTLLNDPVALRADLERALSVVAADDHADAPLLVVRAALALHALGHEGAAVDMMFASARRGAVSEAESRLALFTTDPGWRQLISLTIVWLAATADTAAARSLRDRVVNDGVDAGLAVLVNRVDAALDNAPAPWMDTLPPVPSEGVVMEMLERLAGNDVTGIEPLDAERMNAAQHGVALNDSGAYLAEHDAPLLVSFALHHGGEHGNAYLKRYIAAQSANGYEYYRNRSLWAIVAPVLLHPDAGWVLEKLVVLCTGALSTTIVRFGQALPFTVLALRARAGDAAAMDEFARERDAARVKSGGISRAREGDPWSHHLRRLIAFAEIETCAFARQDEATDLAGRAKHLRFGFAGFNAAARLTLAELCRVMAPADSASLADATKTALASAHNVQDYVFAARATSRVETIRLTHANTTPAEVLPALVAEFSRNTHDGRFLPRHVVGEQFTLRSDNAHRLPVPNWARGANTLESLARMYMRPVADFVRLAANDADASQVLPNGAVVAVPDPDFAPMLAARLAADALAAYTMPLVRRARLIQQLVPLAVRDYTSLDVVLSRLLLAALPKDARALEHLVESVERYVPDAVMREAPQLAPVVPSWGFS